MTGPDLLTRKLVADDFEQSLRLGAEAFGGPPAGSSRPTSADFPFPGRHSWGTFDDDLVARVVGCEFGSWFRGVQVATTGIAGVTVVAEHRGAGLLGDLFRVVLEEGAGRGEVISTLFPTAPGIYRRLGYELIGSHDTVDIPTAALAQVRAPAGVTIRRAGLGDVPAVRELYAAWAAPQNGPLTRTGASFPDSDAKLLGDVTGLTLVEDRDGRPVGYASWDRGHGYGADAILEVEDLVALTPDAACALWRMLSSFASVTGQVRLATSGLDPVRLVLPFHEWQTVGRHPYMLRVHDVAGALSALPLTGDGEVRFAVAGDPLGTMDGGYVLRVADGRTVCEPAPTRDDVPVLTPQGMALAYAGAQSCSNLRMAGHLTGATSYDAVLDGLLGGRQVHIRDYF